MNVDQLDDTELLALVVLAKHMVHADGEVSNTELVELMSLGEVVGMQRFMAALDASENLYQSRNDAFGVAAKVQNYDAKVLIFIVLEELAKGDGMEGIEKHFLAELRNGWQI